MKNGVIQFDELALYVKREVTGRVELMGARQEPAAFKATAFGEGEIVFTLPLQTQKS
jgi:hypothetical protein